MTQIKLVTTQASQASPEPINPLPPDVVPNSSLGVIHLLGFIMIWGIALWSVVKGRKESRARIHSPESNIPCQNCQFFHDNYYFKCAVNPLIVMTQSAIECSDYCPSEKALKMQQRAFSRRHFP